MSLSKVYFNLLNTKRSNENVPSTLVKSLPQVQGNSSKVPLNARIVKPIIIIGTFVIIHKLLVKLIISDMNQEEKTLSKKQGSNLKINYIINLNPLRLGGKKNPHPSIGFSALNLHGFAI